MFSANLSAAANHFFICWQLYLLTAHQFFICWRLNSIETSSSFHSIGIWCSSAKINHNWFLTRRSCTRVRGIIPPIGDPCHYWIQKMSLLKGRVADLPENGEGDEPNGKKTGEMTCMGLKRYSIILPAQWIPMDFEWEESWKNANNDFRFRM